MLNYIKAMISHTNIISDYITNLCHKNKNINCFTIKNNIKSLISAINTLENAILKHNLSNQLLIDNFIKTKRQHSYNARQRAEKKQFNSQNLTPSPKTSSSSSSSYIYPNNESNSNNSSNNGITFRR